MLEVEQTQNKNSCHFRQTFYRWRSKDTNRQWLILSEEIPSPPKDIEGGRKRGEDKGKWIKHAVLQLL